MNERKGEVFSIAEENAPVEGCTVSKAVPERTSAPKHTTTINSG